ncbi:hypothetical protein TRVA0_002S05358 [Trichomonascus vanleenenianus]|uniref:FAD-dependent oxidoreductase n=1 Tax=Trichomonascus vanleenenianus TaxID=2268995 RepID=UPI003ECACF4F
MGDRIVILGSGIIGLYTALLLADKDKARDVTVVAQHLPGDYAGHYTSPWAGGNFSFIAGDDDKALRHDKLSFLNLDALFKKFGKDAGLDRYPVQECFETKEEASPKKVASMKSYIPDFRELSEDELPAGCKYGVTWTTYNFNSPAFLKFLKEYLTKHGVTFIRKKVEHIDEAFLSAETKVVFNCTGIGARFLGGVEDEKVYPTRGQVVVVRAPHIKFNRAIEGKGYITYCIPRPYSNGQVVLGGYLQANNWNTDTLGYETESILDRATQMVPELLQGGQKPLEIIREAAGLRPSRQGGVRIEKETRAKGIVIHNYGASGTGYQSGYGMAMEAVALLKDSKL